MKMRMLLLIPFLSMERAGKAGVALETPAVAV